MKKILTVVAACMAVSVPVIAHAAPSEGWQSVTVPEKKADIVDGRHSFYYVRAKINGVKAHRVAVTVIGCEERETATEAQRFTFVVKRVIVKRGKSVEVVAKRKAGGITTVLFEAVNRDNESVAYREWHVKRAECALVG